MVAPAPLRVELIAFTPRKPTSHHLVIGYASVSLPDLGVNIYDVKLTRRRADVFSHLPERIVLEGDMPARNQSGKFFFSRVISFHDHERYLEFSRAVVGLCRAAYPEDFEQSSPKAPIPVAEIHGASLHV